MQKKKMVIIINDNYEVRTDFKGNTDELMRCYRALARHIKEQARTSAILADAANYTPNSAPSLDKKHAAEVRREAKENGMTD